MNIFKIFKNEKNKKAEQKISTETEFECKSLYILDAFLISDKSDFPGAIKLDLCLLARKDDLGNFYELFTGKHIRNDDKQHKQYDLNIPYYTKVRSLSREFLTDSKMKKVKSHQLFDFLIDMNLNNCFTLLEVEEISSFSGSKEE